MKRKLFVMIVIAIMATGTLVGCGGSDSADNSSAENTKTISSVEEAPTEDLEDEEEPSDDYSNDDATTYSEDDEDYTDEESSDDFDLANLTDEESAELDAQDEEDFKAYSDEYTQKVQNSDYTMYDGMFTDAYTGINQNTSAQFYYFMDKADGAVLILFVNTQSGGYDQYKGLMQKIDENNFTVKDNSSGQVLNCSLVPQGTGDFTLTIGDYGSASVKSVDPSDALSQVNAQIVH